MVYTYNIQKAPQFVAKAMKTQEGLETPSC